MINRFLFAYFPLFRALFREFRKDDLLPWMLLLVFLAARLDEERIRRHLTPWLTIILRHLHTVKLLLQINLVTAEKLQYNINTQL